MTEEILGYVRTPKEVAKCLLSPEGLEQRIVDQFDEMWSQSRSHDRQPRRSDNKRSSARSSSSVSLRKASGRSRIRRFIRAGILFARKRSSSASASSTL